jgi:hypothetical protein
MDFRFFLQGISKVIITPGAYWEMIIREKTSVSHIRNSMLFVFAVLVAVFGFAGSIIFTNSHLAPVYSVLYSVQCFAVILLSVYLTSAVLVIGSGFSGISITFGIAFRMIVISLIPFFLCQLLSKLFESFQFVNILALFGLNIFWIGMQKQTSADKKQKLTLLIITFITFFLLYVISDFVLGLIADRLYFRIFA